MTVTASSNDASTIVRYILVGILNTGFGYSIFALLVFVNVHYSLAVLISTILGVLFNFKTIGCLVFNNRENALLFKFISVYAATYVLNVLGLKLLGALQLNLYAAGALLLIPVTAVSYLLHRFYVFRGKNSACPS